MASNSQFKVVLLEEKDRGTKKLNQAGVLRVVSGKVKLTEFPIKRSSCEYTEQWKRQRFSFLLGLVPDILLLTLTT